MDSMFIPYRELLEKPTSTNTNVLILLLIVFFFVACILYIKYRKDDEEIEPEVVKEEVVKEPPPAPAPQPPIPTAPLPPPPPPKEPENPNDRRALGFAVRDTLLRFSLKPEQIAAIVRFTLTTTEPPPITSTPATQSPATQSPAIQPRTPATQTLTQTPTHSILPSKIFSTKGLELPIEEDEVEQEPAGEKQGKINADTNPTVLAMAKARG